MKQDFILKLKRFFEREGKIFAIRNESRLDITTDIKEFLLFIDTKNMIEEESYKNLNKQIVFMKNENEELKKKIKLLEKYKQMIEEIKLRQAVLGFDEDHRIMKKLRDKNKGELFQVDSFSMPIEKKENDEVIKVLEQFDELKPPKF